MKNKKKLIAETRKKVQAEISEFATQHGSGPEGLYARGLASEGYNGGYRDALDDVILLMNGLHRTEGVGGNANNHW